MKEKTDSAYMVGDVQQPSSALALLMDKSGMGLWEQNCLTGRQLCSEQLVIMTGYTAQELETANDLRGFLVHEDDRHYAKELYAKCVAGKIESDTYKNDMRIVCKNGDVKWVAEHTAVTSRTQDGSAEHTISMFCDITREKQTEERLRAQAQHCEQTNAFAGLIIWDFDIAQNYIAFNDSITKLLGYETGEVNGTIGNLAKIMHPEDFEKADIEFKKYMANAKGRHRQEPILQMLRLKHKNGGYMWVRNMASIEQWDEKGEPISIQGGMWSVDEVVRTEQKLSSVKVEIESQNQKLQNAVRSAVAELEAAKSISTTMFEGNPHINILFSLDEKVLDCNPAALSFFGFSSKEEMQNGMGRLMRESTPEYQPNGTKSVPIAARIKKVLEKGYIEFEMLLNLYGEEHPLNVIMKRIPYSGGTAVLVYMVDLAALRAARNELQRQDALLLNINSISNSLASAHPESFEHAVWQALGTLGTTVQVDRVYVWENSGEGDKIYMTQTHEWSEGAQPQQGESFSIMLDYDEMPYWKETLRSGKIVNSLVKDLPKGEQDVLAPQDIVSILIVPVFIEDEFWGFVGFDDCKAERRFFKWEERALQSGSITIVSAILRNEMTKNLLLVQEELVYRDVLLSAVNTVASLLMSDETENFSDLLYQSMQVLGESMRADRAYVWHNTEVDGRLCCSQLVEWDKGRPSDHSEVAAICLPYDEYVPNWREIISGDVPITFDAAEFESVFENFPGTDDVRSLLVIPINMGGEFWGFIGFDDLYNERTFTSLQEDILNSAGMLVAAAVLRNEMTKSLIVAREEALASMNSKSEFLSRMSHEIRTPMNAIIGMTNIAHKTDDIKKIHYCLEKIDGSSRQLLGIINDVLDMSKIDANKFEIHNTEFDFEKMMQNVFNVVQVRLDEKHQNFQFHFEEPFTRNIISDELRLSQVLINLLTNAVKFTAERGDIMLRVLQTPLEDDRSLLRVEVVDNGIGVAKDRQANLFTSFEQADGSITRQYGGTGLGLAICKKIVELMGGRIWLESEKGVGSHFIFEVAVGWGSSHVTNTDMNKNLHVLVVDDSEDVRTYFANIIRGFSLQCDVAESGEAAIKMAQAQKDAGTPYNMLFVDWKMPGMNGGETAEQIRRAAQEDIIVVMISSCDWADIEQDVKKYDISNFLAKPVLPSMIYDTFVCLSESARNTPKCTGTESVKDWRGKTVLLVEDIDINLEILMTVLEETGVNMETASNGAEAVEKFRFSAGKYSLIMMDVQMPVMDGLAATRAIRSIQNVPGASKIPIIAMTANAFKEDEENCLAAGMNAHVAKPLEVEALFSTLGKWLDDK